MLHVSKVYNTKISLCIAKFGCPIASRTVSSNIDILQVKKSFWLTCFASKMGELMVLRTQERAFLATPSRQELSLFLHHTDQARIELRGRREIYALMF